MSKRKIIRINEKKCNGCGVCLPNCPEGAIQIIDGKARLISDIFCDGLGACIGNCPQDAITIQEREAEKYDETKTMENIVKAGENTIIAHLKHLKEHGEEKYFNQAIEFLKDNNIDVDYKDINDNQVSGCPGEKIFNFQNDKTITVEKTVKSESQLRQWPIQLHLVAPNAPYFQGKDVILVADCVGYSIGDFHDGYLKNRSITIACPKLDSNINIYVDKLTKMIDIAKINTLTVMTMQVPCCSGLLGIAKKASENASRKIPIKSIIVGIKGDILKEEWI